MAAMAAMAAILGGDRWEELDRLIVWLNGAE